MSLAEEVACQSTRKGEYLSIYIDLFKPELVEEASAQGGIGTKHYFAYSSENTEIVLRAVSTITDIEFEIIVLTNIQ